MNNEFDHIQTDQTLNARYRQNIYPYYCPITLYDEVFVQISSFMPDIEDYFWISNYGRGFNSNNGYLITPTVNKEGYVFYTLQRKENEFKLNNKSKYVSIAAHILTCRAFNGPKPNETDQVNHKDFYRDNNHYSNLEWKSGLDNLKYSMDNGRYWKNDIYCHTVYTADKIHEICKLLESGITDPNELSMRVFGEPVNQKYYSLIQKIRNNKNWTRISSQYNIPIIEKRNFTHDEYIHTMCKYFSDNPGSIHDDKIGIKDIFDNYDEFDKTLKHRLSSALCQLRYKGQYNKIKSQYNII